jgi:hypothetical protein
MVTTPAFTYQMMMPSSQAVIDVYVMASTIEGLIVNLLLQIQALQGRLKTLKPW